MAFFSHTRTHTRTCQMTEWYVWQLWEVSEMLHGYWLMAFSFTHTHTHGHDKWQNDISDNYEKFQRCFTDTGSWFSFSHTHTRGHDRWQNMSYNCEKFQECYTHTSSWHFSFTQTRTWQMTEYISDSCEKFQRCYTDTGSWHSLSHTHTHTRTWLKTEWYIWQLWEVSELLQWYTATGSWHSSPRHTHTDMTGARIIYLTIVRSFRDITRILAHGIHFHTHTHTHRAFINGTHNTIMEIFYQWCCSWCIHTTSPDGWNLASTFPYRNNCSLVPVTQCIFQSWELNLSIFLDFLEHGKS